MRAWCRPASRRSRWQHCTPPVLPGALAVLSLCACATATPASRSGDPVDSWSTLRADLEQRIADSGAEIGLTLIDLAGSRRIDINADLVMHAASTMKVPVLYEMFRRAETGEISLSDELAVRNEFRSLVGDTTFTLSPADDSDSTLYTRVGQSVTWLELARLMITRSSNLATNILIDRLDADRVRRAMDATGAGGMKILRGVEDGPAFRRGLNNTTTARALAAVLEAIARCRGFDDSSCAGMLEILAAQEFNEMIPAGLPEGVVVAHKTGWITGIRHDGGIVYPTGRSPYILVILTRGFSDAATADSMGASLSRRIWSVLGDALR
jgi:beta-lactamase class A